MNWTMLCALSLASMIGCGNKNDTITRANKTDAAAGVSAPSIEQTKAIAEEGFIYGLPLVMNYAAGVDYDDGSR